MCVLLTLPTPEQNMPELFVLWLYYLMAMPLLPPEVFRLAVDTPCAANLALAEARQRKAISAGRLV